MQEILIQILTWVSLFVGIGALVLAGYTIWLARITERETRDLFQRSEDRMREHYERMKDVLAAIESRSAGIEQTVKLSQEHLLTTMTHLVSETLIPKRPDMGEQIGLQFMQSLLQNPSQSEETMKLMKTLVEFGQAAPNIRK